MSSLVNERGPRAVGGGMRILDGMRQQPSFFWAFFLCCAPVGSLAMDQLSPANDLGAQQRGAGPTLHHPSSLKQHSSRLSSSTLDYLYTLCNVLIIRVPK